MLRTLGILIGAAGTFIFIMPVFAGIFNFGSFAGTVFSLGLLLGCLFEKQITMLESQYASVRFLRVFIQAGYAVFLIIAAAACLQMYRETRNLPGEGDDQTMIVLGCGLEGDRPSQMLWRRLVTAESYLKQHPAIPVIVSGGQGSDEIMPEAECMKDWLVRHGIDEKRIWCEDRSASTFENLSFSREIIKNNALPEQIIIVTNNFHSCRAGMIAAKQGYAYSSLPADTTWWLYPISVLREVFGIALEWVSAS